MLVAHELHKHYTEVEQYSPDELGRWLAYFKLKAKKEEAAMKRKTKR